MKVFGLLYATLSVSFASAFPQPQHQKLTLRTNNGLQTAVTWDSHSLFIHGERTLILSGEFHPWRLPVPFLWSDIFDKIRALGFNTVSFYVHWGMIEYARGDFNFENFLSLQPFFDAAREKGMYLIARPGPYINAETTGGGTPGWGTRVPGAWRTDNQTYLDAMEGYVRQISAILAKEQITNGGPVILVQVENEYSYCFNAPGPCPVPWPQPGYMQRLEDLMREEGLTIPTITNEVSYTSNNYAPGSGRGEVDIRGYDNYPLSFICNDTSNWPDGKLPINFWEANHNRSGGNPNSIMEMQAGAQGRWGWFSGDDCAEFIESSFERVFYKNYVSFSTTILNLYMMYGGTNWGGIASPATYTSYDYGSPIKENRMLTREKYSELKLLAQFLRVSPAYLTTRPVNQWPVNTVNGSVFTNNTDLSVTQLADVVGNKTCFWIVRHAAYNSFASSGYKLRISTSRGDLSIPVLGGTLALNGRDSKIHVSDYNIGANYTVLYSSGEILTWRSFNSRTVVVIHGFADEVHETAFIMPRTVANTTIKIYQGMAFQQSASKDGIVTINYRIGRSQSVISIGPNLQLIIVDRNTAFDFWTAEYSGGAAIARMPYLLRSTTLEENGTLAIRGDLNVTDADIEVWADEAITSLTYNSKPISAQKTPYGSLTFHHTTIPLTVALPDLSALQWRYIDGLPEIQLNYSDARWLKADFTNSTNPRKPTTPTSLYASDYGFHTNNILWRGHFTASGQEQSLTMELQGGAAFAVAVYLDNRQLIYYAGEYGVAAVNLTAHFPVLTPQSQHTITVIQDHMGLEQNYGPGGDLHKIPRGILNFAFTSGNGTALNAPDVQWKVTGNLGGEHYIDRIRGPLNEGGLFPERQGFHQPGAPTHTWRIGSPRDGIPGPGVRFYSATFSLSIPPHLDAPLSITLHNNTIPVNFRAQIYINGYNFGKYASNLGPQTSFPIPEGILNYGGENTIAMSLWGMSEEGVKIESLALTADGVVETGRRAVDGVGGMRWIERAASY